MSNYDLEEDLLLKFQIGLSTLFILTLIISISLSYNSLMDDDKLYSDEEAIWILRINRIIAFLVATGFLFINIKDSEIKGAGNSKSANMQIMASVFSLVSALIVLFVAFNNSSEIISNENPEI